MRGSADNVIPCDRREHINPKDVSNGWTGRNEYELGRTCTDPVDGSVKKP